MRRTEHTGIVNYPANPSTYSNVLAQRQVDLYKPKGCFESARTFPMKNDKDNFHHSHCDTRKQTDTILDPNYNAPGERYRFNERRMEHMDRAWQRLEQPHLTTYICAKKANFGREPAHCRCANSLKCDLPFSACGCTLHRCFNETVACRTMSTYAIPTTVINDQWFSCYVYYITLSSSFCMTSLTN